MKIIFIIGPQTLDKITFCKWFIQILNLIFYIMNTGFFFLPWVKFNFLCFQMTVLIWKIWM